MVCCYTSGVLNEGPRGSPPPHSAYSSEMASGAASASRSLLLIALFAGGAWNISTVMGAWFAQTRCEAAPSCPSADFLLFTGMLLFPLMAGVVLGRRDQEGRSARWKLASVLAGISGITGGSALAVVARLVDPYDVSWELLVIFLLPLYVVVVTLASFAAVALGVFLAHVVWKRTEDREGLIRRQP